MRRLTLSRLAFVALIWTTAVFSNAFTFRAQTDNLLINPGFEQPYIEATDIVARSVAEGWRPFNLPPLETQPQYEAASIISPTRIQSGSDAQKYYSFFSTHTAGVYQRVSGLIADTPLTFSIYVYVWSSNGTDVNVSSDPGGVIVEVGIDPTGGIDPESMLIIWSDPLEVYDSYVQHVVSASSQGESVTVFVKSTVQNAVVSTEIYLDDAALVFDDTAGEPIATDELVATNELLPTDAIAPTSETSVGAAAINTPTDIPTDVPTEAPTESPTDMPTDIPTAAPTDTPTELPTVDVGATQTLEAINAASQAEQTAFILTLTGAAELQMTQMAQLATDQTSTAAVIQQTNDAAFAQATNVAGTANAAILTLTAQGSQPSATPEVIIITATPAPTDTATLTPVVIEPTATTVDALIASATPTSEISGTQAPTREVTATPSLVIPLSETFPGRVTHTVRNGETVGGIAVLYGSSIEAIIAANGLNANALILVGQGLVIPIRTPPTATPLPTLAVTPTPNFYVVQPGDSLSQIARRFNTTVTTLAQLNNIVNINSIYVGQRLILPTGGNLPQPNQPTSIPSATPIPVSYRVQPGDSLYVIALKYNVTVLRLAEVNGISNPNRLFVGQVLVIPQ